MCEEKFGIIFQPYTYVVLSTIAFLILKEVCTELIWPCITYTFLILKEVCPCIKSKKKQTDCTTEQQLLGPKNESKYVQFIRDYSIKAVKKLNTERYFVNCQYFISMASFIILCVKMKKGHNNWETYTNLMVAVFNSPVLSAVYSARSWLSKKNDDYEYFLEQLTEHFETGNLVTVGKTYVDSEHQTQEEIEEKAREEYLRNMSYDKIPKQALIDTFEDDVVTPRFVPDKVDLLECTIESIFIVDDHKYVTLHVNDPAEMERYGDQELEKVPISALYPDIDSLSVLSEMKEIYHWYGKGNLDSILMFICPALATHCIPGLIMYSWLLFSIFTVAVPIANHILLSVVLWLVDLSFSILYLPVNMAQSCMGGPLYVPDFKCGRYSHANGYSRLYEYMIKRSDPTATFQYVDVTPLCRFLDRMLFALCWRVTSMLLYQTSLYYAAFAYDDSDKFTPEDYINIISREYNLRLQTKCYLENKWSDTQSVLSFFSWV